MPGRRALAVVLLTVLAEGCSSGSDNHAAGRVVPWTSKKPPQVAERAAVAIPCRAADLELPGQVRFVPRLQGGIALVAVRNAGTRTCRLTGRPQVRFVKHGGPVQVQRPIPATPANFPELTYPASSLLALRPGESGAVTITWVNWCDPVIKGKPHVPPSAVRFTLPHGRGSLETDYNAVPACVDPNSPSTIGVSVFQAGLVAAHGRPWSNAFLRATVPGQPVHAKRGGTLRFQVVLKNVSKTTAGFARCPAYIQQLAPSGKVEAFDLNCSAAQPIDQGQSLAFAMRARVPRGAPLGPNGLFWELDPFGIRAPQLHARVTIDP